MIFTDGSSNKKATYVVNGEGHMVQTEPASAQIVELWAVALVFKNFTNKAFNLYTDSQYIYDALQILKTVPYMKLVINKLKYCFSRFRKSYNVKSYHVLWDISEHIQVFLVRQLEVML